MSFFLVRTAASYAARRLSCMQQPLNQQKPDSIFALAVLMSTAAQAATGRARGDACGAWWPLQSSAAVVPKAKLQRVAPPMSQCAGEGNGNLRLLGIARHLDQRSSVISSICERATRKSWRFRRPLGAAGLWADIAGGKH